MPQYTCFGITLRSPLQLPLLTCTSDVLPDVVIDLSPPAVQPQDRPFLLFSDDLGYSQITICPPDVGRFTLCNGTTVSFQPDLSGRFSSLLELYLTGSILSLLLYQRGLLVLHGSVVRIQDRAVAFLGHSGAGKSSAAAACCRQGHAFLADDIVALSLSGQDVFVQSGFPRLKVHIDTAEALDIPVQSLVSVHPEIDDERALQLDDQFCQEAQSLAAVYLLGEGEQEEMKPLSPAAALVELLQHAMPSRYGQNGGARQFEQLSTLVRQVPVFHLLRPGNLEHLHGFSQFVENHLAGIE